MLKFHQKKKKNLHRSSSLAFGQIAGYHGLVNLTHKINYQCDHEVIFLLHSYVPSGWSRFLNRTLSFFGAFLDSYILHQENALPRICVMCSFLLANLTLILLLLPLLL